MEGVDIQEIEIDRRQFIKLKQFIKENDSTAFITVNEATEVFGKGFSNIIGD